MTQLRDLQKDAANRHKARHQARTVHPHLVDYTTIPLFNEQELSREFTDLAMLYIQEHRVTQSYGSSKSRFDRSDGPRTNQQHSDRVAVNNQPRPTGRPVMATVSTHAAQGHPRPSSQTTVKSKMAVCYKCNKPGHYAPDCPNISKIQMLKAKELDEVLPGDDTPGKSKNKDDYWSTERRGCHYNGESLSN